MVQWRSSRGAREVTLRATNLFRREMETRTHTHTFKLDTPISSPDPFLSTPETPAPDKKKGERAPRNTIETL